MSTKNKIPVAYQINNENDLDELVSNFFDDVRDLKSKHGLHSLTADGKLFEFEWGDWFIYDPISETITEVCEEDDFKGVYEG